MCRVESECGYVVLGEGAESRNAGRIAERLVVGSEETPATRVARTKREGEG